MRESLFFMLLSFLILPLAAEAQSGAGRSQGYRFTQNPQACDCFPSSPTSKKYVREGYRFPIGRWRTYTCDFVCIDREGRESVVTGTQTDGYSLSESGTNFVCMGYEMKWVNTPMSRDRLGYLTIGSIRPFRGGRSGVPELEAWAQRASCR